jgi:hypothetical protein
MSDTEYILDENLFLHWYIKIKDKQAKVLDVKHWSIKKHCHVGVLVYN